MQDNYKNNNYKTTSDSKVKTSYIIMPSDLNEKKNLYGGRLLDYADHLAGSVAIRHVRGSVITASVDSFDFIKPFHLGDFLLAEAFISGVGNKSMEIFIKFFGEDAITGERFLGAYCFYTFVATNLKEGETLAKIIPESEEEKKIMAGYEDRKKRNLDRVKRNEEFKNFIKLEY
ncbi:Thioesterase superfamily protein [Anaerosphaera aminiphila DSM 21120]|uniref:Thioesterase superfamily protein n=1 Tax=Anaerosphaera aminiphila DSM 21120 TaxID=1120995 RepID=A0A1M5PVK6_9FIRM|nr:acyl-CoA thioesterase [Anaerosphaera aminiphila]SHH05905.1 Thioesterase superfamily protein [Anaerosphaera aminiphila DSM 21120]